MTLTKTKVFLSSTRKDLQLYRDLATTIIASHHIEVHRQEDLPDDGQGTNATVFSNRRMEDGCNWYIGIVAFRYGHSTDGMKSVTQSEYEHAKMLFDRNVYERVFVMLAESPDDFDESDDIRTHSTDEILLPDDYKNQMDFRDELDDSVVTLFNSQDDFKKKLNFLLKAHVLGENKITKDIILESYKGLTDSERQLRDNSKEAMEALKCLQRFKDLHFLAHQFRKEVLVPVKKSIYTNDSDESANNAHGKDNSKEIIKFQENDEYLKIFAHEAARMKEKLARVLVHDVLYEVDSIKDEKALFLEHHNELKDFDNRLGEFIIHIDFILDGCEKGVSEYTKKFRSPAEDALNRLEKLMHVDYWESRYTNQRNKWRKDLDDTRGLRVKLIESVKIHESWQQHHGKLSKLDRSCSELRFCKNNDDPQIKGFVDKFLAGLEKLTLGDQCDISDDSYDLIKTLCPDNSDMLVGLKKEEFDNALNEFSEELLLFKTSDKIYDVRSGTDLSRFIEKYDKFRDCFDNAFFHVGRSLRDRCHKEAEWIDPLYSLLDEIHTCIEDQENKLRMDN